MSSESPDLEPGERRFWHGVPNKSATKPLMIELRQMWRATGEPDARYSRVIGYGTCTADDEAVSAEKARILKVAGDLDKYTGVHK